MLAATIKTTSSRMMQRGAILTFFFMVTAFQLKTNIRRVGYNR
jgi:hypothetical protein